MSSPKRLSRRTVISSAAIGSLARPATFNSADRSASYTLSVNIEIMFPRSMPRPKRMEAVAEHGMKAYSFRTASAEERDAMLGVQQRTKLRCASIVGSGMPGRTTGLTKPGFEQAYLEAINENCAVSKNFGGPDLIIFVGEVQDDVPPETQHRNIVAGLKKAGDIAQRYGVYLVLEALNR